MDVQWYSKLGGSVLGSQIRVRFYCILVSSTVQKQAFLGDQRLNCPWVRLWEWTVCEACDGLVLCPGFGSYEVGENWKLKLMHGWIYRSPIWAQTWWKHEENINKDFKQDSLNWFLWTGFVFLAHVYLLHHNFTYPFLCESAESLNS